MYYIILVIYNDGDRYFYRRSTEAEALQVAENCSNDEQIQRVEVFEQGKRIGF